MIIDLKKLHKRVMDGECVEFQSEEHQMLVFHASGRFCIVWNGQAIKSGKRWKEIKRAVQVKIDLFNMSEVDPEESK